MMQGDEEEDAWMQEAELFKRAPLNRSVQQSLKNRPSVERQNHVEELKFNWAK